MVNQLMTAELCRARDLGKVRVDLAVTGSCSGRIKHTAARAAA